MPASATVIYAPAMVISVLVSPPHLTTRSWVFLAGTAVLQTGYFLFLPAGPTGPAACQPSTRGLLGEGGLARRLTGAAAIVAGAIAATVG